MYSIFNRLVAVVFLLLLMNSAQGQVDYSLEFRPNGQLISSPPEKIIAGKKLVAKIILDQGFWISRTNSTISSWIRVIENLKKFSEINSELTYGLTTSDIKTVRAAYACQLNAYVGGLPVTMITAEQQAYFLKKIAILVPDLDCTSYAANQYAPAIASLVNPKYKIIYRFYNSEGKIINSATTPVAYSEEKDFSAVKNTDMIYAADETTLPTGCSEVRYEIRLSNNINVLSMEWNSAMDVPQALKVDLQEIIKGMDAKFNADIQLVSEGVGKLQKNPLDATVDVAALSAIVKKRTDEANTWRDKIQTSSVDRTKWLLSWLWLTDGLVRVNPFDSKATLFSGTAAAKVSAENKATYEIFDNMVSKGALQLSGTKGLDEVLKQMAAIKASIAAEASASPNEPSAYDRLLYSGILKLSIADKPDVFMRHLDAASNYLIMGKNPVKEITELERMYLLAENKPVVQKLSLSFSSSPIVKDEGLFTGLIGGIPADLIDGKQVMGKKVEINKLINEGLALIKLVNMLKALSPLPMLPIFFEKDQTADLGTQVLEHNYLVEVPATAAYSVKVIAADNTEKEVASGSYRINKFYCLRFKAGLLYSGLKKRDFTELSEGKYSLDDPAFGIDGTFGLQLFMEKQDMRNPDIKYRPYVYLGLSMKKISENFYLGMGLEPITGLGLGVNAHIGRREALLGSQGVPMSIKQTWGVGLSGSILIDAALFTKMLGFGSNKSLLGF